MVSTVLSSLVCVLGVILLPTVWADYCSSYLDTHGQYLDTQQCINQYCCGSCNQRYCCSEKKNRLTQERCYGSHEKQSKIAVLLGSILGSIFPIILCVGLIICCVSPCCLIYKKCRQGRNRAARNTITTIMNEPQQPVSPSGYQATYPCYQPVPVLPGYGGPPVPTAPPPSYFEATDPALSPAAFDPGQPMYLLPSQPYAPHTYSDEREQLPYNPLYVQNL